MADFSGQWKGRTIDNAFPLRRLLNGGGDRAVFLTTFEGLDAAIKLVYEGPQRSDAQLSRWRAAAKLSHRNLIKIFGTGRAELDGMALLYIVTELAEEDLSQVLPDRSLTAVEVREMLEPAVGALEYIHRQGFVHAHLKPSNIMAVQDDLKISSDGICRLGASDGSGPSSYDPPERALGIVAPAGDIWSLGMTLVEVLTQRLPAAGPEIVLPPHLPEPFAEIARHCLRSNSEERWTVSQILESLHPGRRAIPPPAAATRKKGLPVGVMILLAVVVVLVAGVIIRRSSETATPTEAPKEAAKAPYPPATPEATPEPVKPAETAKAPERKKREKEPAPTVADSTPSPEVPAAEMVDQPMPDITAQARRTIRGKVTVNVKVVVDPSGTVTEAKLDSPAASRYFTSRALDAVRRWKFKPVSVNGSDSAQRWRIHFEFLSTGTKVQPKRLSP